MFTGIIKATCVVSGLKRHDSILSYSIKFDQELLKGLQTGASVAVDGTCQTVVSIDGDDVWFDAIDETLQKTTINDLKVGDKVHIERAARFGDEIGGHVLSGHITCTASVHKIEGEAGRYAMFFRCDPTYGKYLFPKGYLAIHGASLTLVDVDAKKGVFSVHLIPETLRLTTLGSKRIGEKVNIEFDTTTQVIVDTIERIHQANISTS